MRRSLTLAAILLAGTLLLAACGGNDHSSTGMDMSSNGNEANAPVVPGAREIPVEAGALSFTPKRIQLTPGEDVTIVLTSTDIAHDFYVKGIGHVVHAGADKTARGGLMIDELGTYKFWCTVKGHKEGGMVGTITVA